MIMGYLQKAIEMVNDEIQSLGVDGETKAKRMDLLTQLINMN